MGEAEFMELKGREEYLVVHNIVQLAGFSGVIVGAASSPKTGYISYVLVFKEGSLLAALVSDPRRGISWSGDHAVERLVKYISEGDALYHEVLAEFGEIPLLLTGLIRTEKHHSLPVRMLEASLDTGVILHSRIDELSASLTNPVVLAGLLLHAKYYSRQRVSVDNITTVLSNESVRVAPSMLYAKVETGGCGARFLAFNGIIVAAAVEARGKTMYGRKALEALPECGVELVLSLYRVEAESLGAEYVGAVEEITKLSEAATLKAVESRISFIAESLGVKGVKIKVSSTDKELVIEASIPKDTLVAQHRLIKRLFLRVLQDRAKAYIGRLVGKEIKVVEAQLSVKAEGKAASQGSPSQARRGSGKGA